MQKEFEKYLTQQKHRNVSLELKWKYAIVVVN